MSQISPAKLNDLVWEADPNLIDQIMRLTREVSAIASLLDHRTIDVLLLRRDLERVVEKVAGGDPDAQRTAYVYSGMRNLVDLVGTIRRNCAELKSDLTSDEARAVELRNWRGKHFVPAWALVDAPDDDEVEGS